MRVKKHNIKSHFLEKALLTTSMVVASVLNLNAHVTEEPGFKAAMNPYSQPNMHTLMGRKLLDYYGSGDVNNNGTIDSNDANAILAGTETGNDRADVNGDGTVNSTDATIINNYVNGTLTRLPSDWNHLNKAERIDWFTKMLEIDKTDERQYITGVYDCSSFSTEHLINFFGVENLENWLHYAKFAQDGDDNARFNIPVYMVATKVTPLSSDIGTTPGGHYVIGVLVGPESGERYAEDPTRFSDWYFVEPQADFPVVPGDWSMNANEYVHIEGFLYYPTMDLFYTQKIINFELTNGEPNEISPANYLLLTNPNSSPEGFDEMSTGSKCGFDIYPIPTKDKVTFKYATTTPQEVEFYLFDIRGKLLDQFNAYANTGENRLEYSFKSKNLKSGFYLLKIKSESCADSKTVILK